MKLDALAELIDQKKSPPARGRGLKPAEDNVRVYAGGRPPRGGVD